MLNQNGECQDILLRRIVEGIPIKSYDNEPFSIGPFEFYSLVIIVGVVACVALSLIIGLVCGIISS